MGPSAAHFSENLILIQHVSITEMDLKTFATKYRSFWSSLDVLTHSGLMRPYGDMICVNIDLGNGLLSDGTKPLQEPMLTYRQ